MEANRAYITVLSSDEYLIGVLCLNESLKIVNSKYPLVVLVNDKISEKVKEVLKENHIQTIDKKSFKLPDWIIEKNKNTHANWSNTFDKLSIFELTEFDKLVFLDSDMFVRNNIDELFEKPDMSATVDRNDTVLVKENYQKITSGMLVFEPKVGMISEFMSIINDESIQNKYASIGDQDIIQMYYKGWDEKKELHLPVKYNMFFGDIEYYVNKGIYSLDDISIIHFITSNKPWKYSETEIMTKYLDWLEEVASRDYEKNKLEEIKENIAFGRENKKKVLEEYSKILYKYKKSGFATCADCFAIARIKVT